MTAAQSHPPQSESRARESQKGPGRPGKAARVGSADPAASSPDGILVIDKPAGWTSHDVVARVRKVMGTRKVGHAGTLDPDATGVLVLGLGRATRLLRFVTPLKKVYEAEIVLGVETTTLDASGDVVARHDMSAVTADEVREAVTQLTGVIRQVPPMVSAVKIEGRRLYQLAREGKVVKRPARTVTVSRFEIEEVPGRPGVWQGIVECSSGTYVRSLAADLGRALGGGAHLSALRRTAIGNFRVKDAHPIESPVMLPMARALGHLPAVRVDERVARKVRHGSVLDLDVLGVRATGGSESQDPQQQHWAVYGTRGSLLAVYEPFGTGAKPTVVLVAG